MKNFLIFFLLLPYLSLSATVVAHLRGQWGNQLFQIAAAVALAEENHTFLYFPDFQNLSSPHLKEMELSKNYEAIFRKIPNQLRYAKVSYLYKQPDPAYHPIPYTPNMEIDGFFQSEKYFKKYASLIRNLFAAPKSIQTYLQDHFAEILNHPKTVAIHVRTGYFDFKKERCSPRFYRAFLPPDLNFFKKAVSLFDADSLFIVFSDYIPWCKKNFQEIPRQIIFMEDEDYLHDFYLMTKCKHAIISNSSFGWWAAYLNENPQKKIVCRRPFIPVLEMPAGSPDVLCDDWIALDMPTWPPIPRFEEDHSF